MADISLIDTTFTAKNISTAISVYEYTVPGTGLIYKLRFQVRLYQVAGGGDYTINLRLNDGDATADDPIVPKTTYTAAAGTQNMWFVGISVDGMSGDVFNVMVLGQAGDTAVIGSIRIFADDAVGVTTYGNTLDVATTSEAGLDFNNIKAASGATTLTNITVPIVTTVNGLAAGVITAAAIATGAIDADALAADAGTELGTAVWASETRTLTQAAASVISSVSGAKLTITRGDTLAATFTGLAANTSYVSIDFSYKRSPDDADDDAIIRIRKNASTTGDGLMRFLGAAIATPYAASDASITVVSSTSITINLKATNTDDLTPGIGHYDIQYIFAASALTATDGICEVVGDITRLVA